MRFLRVPFRDESLNGGDKGVGTLELTVPQDPTGHDAEPELDLVQPGAVCRRVVEEEAVSVATVPLGHVGAFPCVDVGVQIVEDHMDSTSGMTTGHEIQEGEEIFAFPRLSAPSDDLARLDVEAAEETARAVPAVLEILSRILPRFGRLQGSNPRERLHAGLLIDGKQRCPLGGSDVQFDDLPHLLLISRVIAVAPHLHPMRLDLGFLQDPANGGGADRLDEFLPLKRFGEGVVAPDRAAESKALWREASGRDHLVPLKRCDDLRTTRARTVTKAGQPVLAVPLNPSSNDRTARSHHPCDLSDGFTVVGEQEHPGATPGTGFTPLSAHDTLQGLAIPCR